VSQRTLATDLENPFTGRFLRKVLCAEIKRYHLTWMCCYGYTT